MADYGIPKAATAYIFYGCLVSQADTKLLKSAPTLAAGDFKVSIDGGAFANLATLPTNTPGTFAVKFSLSAGEMTGDNILVVASDAAGAEWCDQSWNIQTSPRGIADLAYPATSGRSMVVDAAGLVDANAVKVGPTGSGTAQTAGDIPGKTNSLTFTGANKVDASVRDWIGGTIPAVNVTGVPKVDPTHLLGTAWAAPATAGLPDVNVKQISADGTAADNAEAFFDGTGYAGTGNTIPTVTTLTGHTAQTGDVYPKVDTEVAAIKAVTDALPNAGALTTIQADLDDLQTQVGAAGAGLTAIPNSAGVGTLLTRLGTPSDLGGGATVAANLADIEGQTDDIGAAGAGLTAVPWNATWDAEVQSEVDDALVARSLDKLVLASGTADSGSTTTMVDAARTEGDADYWKGRLLVFTSGVIAGQCAIVTDFNAGTDTFTFAPAVTQAVATQTYIILPGISAWDDVLAEHLGVGSTGAALNAAGSAGDPWGTALPGAYGAGSAGKIVGDNLTGNAFTRLGAPAGASVSADVAAVQADTNDIQTRVPAALVSGRMDASVGAMAAGVVTAAAVATNAIDADALAADAVVELKDEIWSVVPSAYPIDSAGWTLQRAKDQTDTLVARITATLFTGITSLAQWIGLLAGKQVGNTTARTELRATGAGSGTFDETTDSQEAQTDAGYSTLTAAGVRTAVGLASANLDTQLGDLPTNAELATALGTADDATLTQIALVKAKTDNLPADPADASDVAAAFATASTKLDTIDDFLDTEIAAIKAKTDNLPASPAAVGSAMTLTSGERDAIAAALLDLAAGVETGFTVRQSLRGMAAALMGKADGAATPTMHFRDLADSKNRLTATVDADGNRTAVTRDLT